MDKTVLQTVEEAAEDWRLDDIKGLLGRCNFKSDMLDRKVSLLSGGEKVRKTPESDLLKFSKISLFINHNDSNLLLSFDRGYCLSP